MTITLFFWADPSGADAVDIGYDRIVDSQDLMGSYHWSGGFQEVENEGGTGEKGESAKSQTGLGKIFSKIGKGIRSVFGGKPKYTVDTSGMTYEVKDDMESGGAESTTFQKSVKTASALVNAYTGYNEFAAGVGLLLVPEPTTTTKVGGAYLATDGAVRGLSTLPTIFGIWTDNQTLANLPSNLLGVGGNVFDNIASSQGSGYVSGGDAQLAGELIGDFGLSKRNLINTLTGKAPTSKTETLIRGGENSMGCCWTICKRLQ